ncbi:hypothetical protein [Marimonas arenosa]|uniref:Uncharacterized protein n=1 Tax=Marimonas arenosa TaxID=1795305 RepID=A0AAE3WI34_9RHOB|nr:hypothetical protein [Marimonas arenosa]MDQ2092050.1 hypothetical protein [Marimonas arenosa]
MWRLILAVFLVAASGVRADYFEPARGTELRRTLMDALRPHIEWPLGAPVEFVVWDLRVADDIAFFSGMAQRPGGGVIDIADTPAARWGELDPEVGDGATVQALYKLSGRTWVAVHIGISATDVWYSWEPICQEYRAVIPEACQQF